MSEIERNAMNTTSWIGLLLAVGVLISSGCSTATHRYVKRGVDAPADKITFVYTEESHTSGPWNLLSWRDVEGHGFIRCARTDDGDLRNCKQVTIDFD